MCSYAQISINPLRSAHIRRDTLDTRRYAQVHPDTLGFATSRYMQIRPDTRGYPNTYTLNDSRPTDYALTNYASNYCTSNDYTPTSYTPTDYVSTI